MHKRELAMSKANVRIKDIAEMAGVSEGTVDRVLHSRGKVSIEASERVNKVLSTIGYKPNLFARTLGSKKIFTIAVLVPDPTTDSYWNESIKGLSQSSSEWEQYGIVTKRYYFNRLSKDSFLEASLEAFHSRPDGVLAAPLFYYASIPFFKVLKENNIPFVLIKTYIPETEPLSFVGQDAFQSGELGAELLFYGHRSPCTYAIIHIQGDMENSINLIEKEKGFKSFFDNLKDKTYNVITANFNDPETSQFTEQLRQLLSTPQLKGIFVSNSKSYCIAQMLEMMGQTNIRLVGYDLMDENLKYLRSGYINALINENQKRQASLGLNAIANYLLNKTVTAKMTLLPLEIITRKNLSSYLAADTV